MLDHKGAGTKLKESSLHLLVFNLATDISDPVLGFTTQWIRALARKSEFVDVITMRSGEVDVPENVRVRSVGKERGFSELRRAGTFYRFLFETIAQGNGIDACFAHMMPVFTVMGAPLLTAKGIPTVTWYAHPRLTWAVRLSHKASDRVVTSFRSAYPYKDDKLIPLGQGIDTGLFRPEHPSKIQEPPLILCTGRLSPEKDHHTLLAAVDILSRTFTDPFQVAVLGGPAGHQDESYADSLRRRVSALELDHLITFYEPVRITDLPTWHQRSVLHVNLTPLGFSDKVALDAMACGTPSVVANSAFRETLGRYWDVLSFPPGNAEQLADRLAYWLSVSATHRVAVGMHLRDQVIRLHNLDSLAEKLIGILETLIASK